MQTDMNKDNSTSKDIKSTEYTGPGSAFRVMKLHEKAQLNAFGEKPVFVKPEPTQKKGKSIN